jgi:hypothetical protein
VAHICNSSYPQGRNQQDCGLKPARGNSSARPYLEKTTQNRADGVVRGVDPEFKPQYYKNKNKQTPKEQMIQLISGQTNQTNRSHKE